MKTIKFVLALLFFLVLLTYTSFAQVNGCEFIGTLDSVVAAPSTVSCGGASSYAILTVTLPNAGDTILVEVGTDLKDSTVAQEEYGQIAVIDLSTGSVVPVITGNTTTNRRYKIDALKADNIRLKGSTNTADFRYIIQYY